MVLSNSLEEKKPYWLLPNLLSLDAPLVAVVWAWMMAQTWRVEWLNPSVFSLLAGAVWIVYVIDRILDNYSSKGERQKRSSRHAFHHKYWVWFRFALFLVAGYCLATMFQLPRGIWFHAVPVVLLVCVYLFLAIISGGRNPEPSLFKNVVAGFTFSYGVAFGVYFFRPASPWFELAFTQEVLFFAGLCVCNITAIDIWEASRSTTQDEKKQYYEFLLSVPLLIIVLLALLMALIGDEYARPYYFTVMLTAGLLQLLNRFRRYFSLDALRALVDLALILPAPFFLLIQSTN